MKKIIYILALLVSFTAFSSCSDDDPDTKNSIFDITPKERGIFDKWLLSNYVYPYNIDFKYRFENKESDQTLQLSPAVIENSTRMAILVKYLWLDVYDEILDVEFTKNYIPKVIHLVGSGGYRANGTVVLGTAEGGLKVTLYYINELDQMIDDPALLNYFYFHTMHHEFAHILHQTKKYDYDFKKITPSDYVGDDWTDGEFARESLSLGFITPYSRNSFDEDFVEIFSTYITESQSWWDAQFVKAGPEGAAIITKKLNMVKLYMMDNWKIDMDELRKIVDRRTQEALTVLDTESLNREMAN